VGDSYERAYYKLRSFELDMKFSTRTTYGLRAMIKLAKNWEKGSLSLPSIARAEGLSRGYLEKLFSQLKRQNLVISVKGTKGGYKLAHDPNKITVYQIIKALEKDISPFHCLDDDGKVYCAKGCDCGALIVLNKVQQAINKAMKNIKLSNLV